MVKFTSFQRDGRRCYEYLFACVKRNKMDSELLLKFIEYFPDYLSALLRTLLRFFGQPLSKQLYTAVSRKVVQLKSMKAYTTIPKGMMGCGCSLLHRQVHEVSARWKAVL